MGRVSRKSLKDGLISMAVQQLETVTRICSEWLTTSGISARMTVDVCDSLSEWQRSLVIWSGKDVAARLTGYVRTPAIKGLTCADLREYRPCWTLSVYETLPLEDMLRLTALIYRCMKVSGTGLTLCLQPPTT